MGDAGAALDQGLAREATAATGELRNVTSLNAPNTGADGPHVQDLTGGLDPGYARVDDYLSLRPLFAALPLREQRILAPPFYGHLTQSKIAADVGVSQMQVPRLLTRSMAQLKAAAEGGEAPLGRRATAVVR